MTHSPPDMSVIADSPQVILDCRHCLGESPVWDDLTQTLHWTNIHAREMWSWKPSSRDSAPVVRTMPERIGALGLRAGGGLVLALERGFATLDDGSLEPQPLAALTAPVARTRLNDGRVSPDGRFLCGGMNEETPQRANAALHSLDADHRVHDLLPGIACANSLCWSPDGGTLYFSDMPTRRIDAFDYADGALANRRVFAELATPGAPDGSIVDEEGFLWNAQWGGAKLVRYAPDGTVDREVPLPVSNPTCMIFGGLELDIMFITTAWFTLDDTQRAREPHAGSLFAWRPGVRGLASPRYRG
ncbi:SMP-30/gluconolactonase/LRE family protein [Caballeronia sp. LZ034LL]|uniref:SMP-30/gluconolactonase/LRE family protein n=1 Tax=Caballeronia sp. LZ034LL TaxID=3038567 RepID=UPI00285B261B|nr:SMP-30/gluconolactonase/LRE family protein [Caballeronia sp. LZ034LL]MDR5839131.1 SMP-30/gluconolactonase/LRE family protein [Caballeronia sp. LZ034LL]